LPKRRPAGASGSVRAILPQLRLPVLVLHNEADVAVPVANGRYLAAHIPGARYIEYSLSQQAH
jgi:pimeloyl-ACP methyl ester carboxylesterase